jgi:hypothetical protein
VTWDDCGRGLPFTPTAFIANVAPSADAASTDRQSGTVKKPAGECLLFITGLLVGVDLKASGTDGKVT